MRKDKTSLMDELALHKGKNVMIGARSSFFFVGPSEEAIADMDILGLMNKYCVSIYNQKRLPESAALSCPEWIGGRDVVRSFERDDASDGCEVAIIVSGKEFGAYWTREEYLAGKKALVEELCRLKA